MKRGSVVRLSRKAHNLEVAGSNPAPASIILSPLDCTKHKNDECACRLFFASFALRTANHGLFKPSFFLTKIMYMTHSETCALQHSVWTGSCIL